MPEVIWLALGLALAAAWVLVPLRRDPATDTSLDDEAEAAAIRHRVALEALRDLEADRRAGTLDEATYAEAVADAEARAAASIPPPASQRAVRAPRDGRRMALAAGAVIAVALLVATIVPGTGVANSTTVNEPLAAARAAEEARQERIDATLGRLSSDPRDPDALSELADAYLEGSTPDDLVRAAVALRLLIELEPERADAYERIVAAYLRAGDAANARAALDAYEDVETADPAELAFLDGLIALRLEDDAATAERAFDRFLELAPDDPRAEMVRGLRDEAADG